MSDYKKLLDALHIIQDECRLHNECDDCPFIDSNKVSCGIAKSPHSWRIKKDRVISLLEDE